MSLKPETRESLDKLQGELWAELMKSPLINKILSGCSEETKIMVNDLDNHFEGKRNET